MRILALSDSHRDYITLSRIVLLHPEADAIVFLGDGAEDMDELYMPKPKQVVSVRGNCDFGSQLPLSEIFTFAGEKIYCTHGHYEFVKYGLETLLEKTQACGAKIALYGHTHIQKYDYTENIHLFNPGSVHNGDYGLVDITENGIICIGNNIGSR